MAVLKSGLSRDVFKKGESRATQLDSPSKEAKAFPFYWLLPRDHLDNIRFRIYVRERCLHDLEFRRAIVEMCRQDVAFFTEVFVSIFEPRPTPRVLPPMLWSDQVDVLAWFSECYGKRDLGLEKSRGIGASWISAIFVYHKWIFHPNTRIGMMSKDESSLDSDDDNSLMGKIAFVHDHMPAWMRVTKSGRSKMQRNKQTHIMVNMENNAVVQGFVPTNNKVRSFRFTCMMLDEFAFLPRDVQAQMNSSSHTTSSRFFVSTWCGPDNLFHRIMRKEENTMLRCEMYWWNNIERWQGCYRWEPGKPLEIIDKNYKFPKDYPFVEDGLVRSPWVDFELARPGSDFETNLEELYGLRAGSQRKLFRKQVIAIIETTATPPNFEGDFVQLGQRWELQPKRDGPLKIWGDLGDGKCGPFSCGCDIAFGRGASYSTAEIIDLTTGEQVLEYSSNEIVPVEFAQFIVNLLMWLNGPHGDGHTFLTFENNGDQGTVFGEEVLRLGYANIMQRAYKQKVKSHEESSYYGMRNKDGGLANLSELERAILDGECTIKSGWLQIELANFDRDEKGRPHYPSTDDGNGDLAQGMGMAWIQARERLVDVPEEHSFNARAEIEDYCEGGRPSWSEIWCGGGNHNFN